MLSIPAIYDGQKFIPQGRFPSEKKFKVLITFVEEIGEEAEVRQFAAQMDALRFWEDEAEDVYQDYLLEKPR